MRDLLAGEHIGPETNRERERPRQMADDFDRESSAAPASGIGPAKCARYLPSAVGLDAHHVVVEENRERQARRDGSAGHGGRFKPGMTPIRFENRMKKKSVPKKARY